MNQAVIRHSIQDGFNKDTQLRIIRTKRKKSCFEIDFFMHSVGAHIGGTNRASCDYMKEAVGKRKKGIWK